MKLLENVQEGTSAKFGGLGADTSAKAEKAEDGSDDDDETDDVDDVVHVVVLALRNRVNLVARLDPALSKSRTASRNEKSALVVHLRC